MEESEYKVGDIVTINGKPSDVSAARWRKIDGKYFRIVKIVALSPDDRPYPGHQLEGINTDRKAAPGQWAGHWLDPVEPFIVAVVEAINEK